MSKTMDIEAKERNTTVDFLKFVAIILVVVGHIMVSLYPENYNENLIFKICYSFHMPLFIFIGGGLTALKTDEKLSQFEWIIKCFKRLIVPYVIWNIVYCLLDGRIDFINALFIEPVLWYLINLFICDLVLFISVHTKKMKYLTLAGACILFLALYGLFREGNLVIKNMAMFFPFYLAGHMIFRSKDKAWVLFLKKYLWLGALLYPVLMVFFTYKQYDLVISKVQSALGISSFGGLIHIAALFYNHVVVAAFGIMFAWFIADVLSRADFLKRPIGKTAYIGRYTMFIYILEGITSYVIDGNFTNNMLISGLGLLFIRLAFPLLTAYILSYIPKVRVVLFGQ